MPGCWDALSIEARSRKQEAAMAHYSTIVSFDIGMLNLAVCVTRVEHANENKYLSIKDWQLINLGTKNTEACSRICVSKLKSMFGPSTLANSKNVWVIIERQSPRNHQCLCISHAIYAFFLAKFTQINVNFVSPSAKPLQSKGQKRKTESVRETKKWLSESGATVWSEWFSHQIKKDDLADSFMQAVSYMEKVSYVPELHGANMEPIVIVISDSESSESSDSSDSNSNGDSW
jgi:hypothetical protein